MVRTAKLLFELRGRSLDKGGLPVPVAIVDLRYAKEMSRREEWRRILNSEVQRWSAKSCEQLLSELRDVQVYEVQLDSKNYQVEVEILENTPGYIQVLVAVDDGSLPASFSPLIQTFVSSKPQRTI